MNLSLPRSKLLTLVLSLFLLLMSVVGITSAAPNADEILKTLKPNHPRLLLDAEKVKELQKLVKEDELAKKLYGKIKIKTDKVLKQEPVVYELRDGRRLIYVSGDVLERVRDLAFVYLITEDKKYMECVWAELESASKFKDWNPAHFLDTAIMTKAFAIGLDWLWAEWTPQERQILQQAIVEKGLKPAMKVYSKKRGWHSGTNNLNQVCNGGIGMGALAVAETEPELAGKILHNALKSIPKAMKPYAPDGAGHEGLGYWGFGSLYNIMLMASLESALGTDFGLSEVDGFRQSGDYQIYMSGTRRMAFDFSDCKRSQSSSAQHFWMGRKYGIPRYTWFRHNALIEGQGGNTWDLLWFDASATGFSSKSIHPDKYFKKVEVASIRDSWTDGDGFIVAMQGGDSGVSHRHLDLGSFILESDGVRWIIDSGKEGETYQRHKNKEARNDFYRIRAEGHNTLVINPDEQDDQNRRAKAKFTSFISKKSEVKASLDLSNAYDRNASKVTRTFELERGKHFTITDNIDCNEPSEVWSFFHTEAKVKLSKDKRTAFMKQNGKTLRMRLGLPADGVFKLLPAEPFPSSPNPAKQTSNKGRSKVAVHLTDVKDTVIAVRFERLESTPVIEKKVE